MAAIGGLLLVGAQLAREPSGGRRFWNPASRRERMRSAAESAGVVLAGIGALLLALGVADMRTSLAVVASLLAAGVLLYGFMVGRLYRDRRIIQERYANAMPDGPEIAARTAKLSWCLRHAFDGGDTWWPRD